MRLRNRFVLVGIGIVIFILLTPIVVLYALGYKFDLSSKQITKTGSLIVTTKPDDVEIYIDNILQTQKSDSTLRFLLPGDYNIQLSKDGYQSWTKRLNIRSGLVTWTNHERDFVTLFYKEPKLTRTENISESSISFKNQEAVLIQNNSLKAFNPNRNSLDSVDHALPVFSPPVILPTNESFYYLFRNITSQVFTPEQLNQAKQLETSSNHAAAIIGSTLYYVKNQTAVSLASNVSGFTLENEHIWYIEENTLKHINTNIGVIETLAELPYTPIVSKIVRGDSQIFLILDLNIYVLNEKLEEIYRGVGYAYWDDNSELLVFANNNEALIYNPSTHRTELIVRTSSPIIQPILNKTTGYLFFMNDGKIKAIEMDGRDHRNVYDILDVGESSFLLNNDGDQLTTFTDTKLQTFKIR